MLASQSKANVCQQKCNLNGTGQPSEIRGCVLIPQSQLIVPFGTIKSLSKMLMRSSKTISRLRYLVAKH